MFFAKIPRHIRQNAITGGDLECILTRNCEGTEQLQIFIIDRFNENVQYNTKKFRRQISRTMCRDICGFGNVDDINENYLSRRKNKRKPLLPTYSSAGKKRFDFYIKLFRFIMFSYICDIHLYHSVWFHTGPCRHFCKDPYNSFRLPGRMQYQH